MQVSTLIVDKMFDADERAIKRLIATGKTAMVLPGCY